MSNDSSTLVIGGTGSFDHTFVPMLLEKFNPRRVIIYPRNEMKQWEMAKKFASDHRVRFLLVMFATRPVCTVIWMKSITGCLH